MIEAPAVEILMDDEAHLDDLRASFQVEVDLVGRRLDDVVRAVLGIAVPRDGRLRVDGRAVLVGNPRLAAGSVVALVSDRIDPAVLPERIPLPILVERADLLVVDKPAGLAMCPGRGHPAGTVANALRGLGRPLSSLEGPVRPGIVHRLDRGTSGALVVAKTDDAHATLARLFLTHAVDRRYVVLVSGSPSWASTELSAPLAPPRPGRKSHRVSPDGRPAITRFAIVRRFAAHTLLHAIPLTGRTHQIRAHLAHLGHPVLGDTLYGGAAARHPRLRRPFLHAEHVALLDVSAHAPLPEDLAAVLSRLAS
jgi:23S rRNA pseudouridine1911/1915/1917 synthase